VLGGTEPQGNPMIRALAFVLLFISALGLANAQSPNVGPERRMAAGLEVDAYYCAVGNEISRLQTKNITNREIISKHLAATRQCVDKALVQGKEFYRNAVDRAPSSKAELANVYSHWLSYMDALAICFDPEGEEVAKHAFERSVNDMMAAVDAPPQ
jgi:hypothetical protein